MKENTNRSTQFLLKSVVNGYLLDCSARRLSPNTLSDYRNTCRKLLEYFGDGEKPIADITRMDMRGFFASQTVGNKTLLGYYHCIKSLWNFAILENIVSENPLNAIKRPKAEIRTIEPIPVEHIKKLLKTIDTTNPRNRARNKALILMLLDTGARVSEICGIKRSQINLNSQSVKILGKQSRERIIYYSPSTAKALWKYMGNNQSDGYLFIASNEKPMTRRNVTAVLTYLCKNTGLPYYSPHKFRHTFALAFLRNGANVFALQRALGHATLDMSKKYLSISDCDVEASYKIASPVMNLGL